MNSSTNTVTSKVALGQKIAFGVGMFANQMFPAILGIFMIILVQDLGFSGLQWGFLFFIPRVFDSITDPIMGFISDNTKSRWGRRRHYVLIGGLIMGISYILMWQLYKENSISFNFWYFLGWSLVFYLGLTIFSVPYVAMGYEMTDDFHERTSIMAIAQWIGQWAWVIAPWFWIIMYDPKWFPSAEVATRQLAFWVAIPCAICAMIPALFINSTSTLDADYEPLNFATIGASLKKIFAGFVDAFKLKPFRQLCLSTFLIFNAFNTVASLTFFVIVFKLFNGDAAASGIWVTLFGCLGALGTTFIVIPIVAQISKKLGKKRAFMIAQSISIVGYVLLWFLFIPGKPWMYIIALPFFSFGIGSLFTIMMSMTADVLDIDELNTGLRREGIFGAIYWWMVKVGFAFAGALSGLIISVVGFDPSLATTAQQGAVDGLHTFFCFFPMVGTVIAMWVMKDYDISEEKSNEIRAKINEKKGIKKAAYISTGNTTPLIPLEQEATLPQINLAELSSAQLKERMLTSLNEGIYGFCFSPYEEGQDAEHVISKIQIERRLDKISPHTQWIRTFASTRGHELIPILAKERGLNTAIGAWIGPNLDDNDKEIDELIRLGKLGVVDIAVVGNEVLYRGELSEEQLIGYISKVKQALPNIKVGYVDIYNQFQGRQALIKAADVIMINCYPYWEGTHINLALDHTHKMLEFTKTIIGDKQIIISETGWPSEGEVNNSAQPSDQNAMKYFIDVNYWAKNNHIPLFYFSSFDEAWKIHHEGEVGGKWGIWNQQENLKF